MIGRVLLAALLAGLAAGFLMGVIQHARLTPLILQAETYERASGHSHGEAAAAHEHGDSTAAHEHAAGAWAPADGWERTAYTFATSMVTGAAFAALLAGVALMLGQTITARSGWLWGLAGFLAASLAPAAGLPPELPGMPAADLGMRQLWWTGAIAATGVGLALLLLRGEPWAKALGVVALALPHLIGAPQPSAHETAVPAGLSALFASNALAAAAVFWICIGAFLGAALDRVLKET